MTDFLKYLWAQTPVLTGIAETHFSQWTGQLRISECDSGGGTVIASLQPFAPLEDWKVALPLCAGILLKPLQQTKCTSNAMSFLRAENPHATTNLYSLLDTMKYN